MNCTKLPCHISKVIVMHLGQKNIFFDNFFSAIPIWCISNGLHQKFQIIIMTLVHLYINIFADRYCPFFLADEQERVQKKTFTNWINMHLSEHDPPMRCTELFEDIKSGVMLLSLLEVLSGETIVSLITFNIKLKSHYSNFTWGS